MLLKDFLMAWMALRNRDGRPFGHQDRRKPEQGATSDMSFEEHLSEVGPEPIVSRDIALYQLTRSPTCSLFAPLQSAAERFFFIRERPGCACS